MKLQALFVAAAVAASGSAFAAGASTADSTKADSKQTTAEQKEAKKTAKQTKSKGASARRMGGAATTPETDLDARDRQGRMDEAYEKWRSSRPS